MSIRQLGSLEADVMARVWAGERPVLVRDVLEDLQQTRAIAYTTVMTVMDNLHKKGYLTRARDGRAYRYAAARTREEHTALVMEQVLAASGDSSATLMHFVQQIDADERAALSAIVAEATRQDRGRP